MIQIPDHVRAAARRTLQAKEQELKLTEAASASLRAFVEQAWSVVEPAQPFIPNWHVDAICEHLEALTNLDIRRLLITVPPGHLKSVLVSVMWPAWVWIKNPQWRGMFSSYSYDLAVRDAMRTKNLIESPWYQDTFHPKWQMSDYQNTKANYENTEKGSRFCTSVGSRSTGFRAHCVACDDALNAKEIASEKALDECIFWWDEVMSSRVNDMRKSQFIIIMQRLAERDLAGHVKEKGDYVHLNLPTEFEPDNKCITVYGTGLRKKTWEDPRKHANELMFPELFPEEVVVQIKKDMGESAWAAQHQQRPSPVGGGMLKKHWWKYWQPRGANLKPVKVRKEDGTMMDLEAVTLPPRADITIQSWDLSFKDNKSSDFVCGLVVAAIGADRFIMDCVHDRMDLPKTILAVRRLSAQWPEAQLKLVEGKANGPALIQSLRHEISGLVEVEPDGNKMSRAAAGAAALEAGNWYLPHPALFPWVEQFVAELGAFPVAKNDDFVDSWSQAAHRLLFHGIKRSRPKINTQSYLPTDPGGDRSWMS